MLAFQHLLLGRACDFLFGTRFPRAKDQVPNLLPDLVKEVFLPTTPTAFTIEEVRQTPDIRFVGSVQANLVLVSEYLDNPKTIPVSGVLDLLQYTSEQGLSSADLSLVDSFALLGMNALPDSVQRAIPRNSTEA